MAEKKKVNAKKAATKTTKKTTAKKTEVKKAPAKKEVKAETKKAEVKKAPVKKEIKKEVVKEEKVEVKKEAKVKKEKKEYKLVKWFKDLTLEQLVVGGFVVIIILLIVLISVSVKNTKTKNGKDIVAKVNGKTITADDLYTKLKAQNGKDITINLIDEFILEKEYKTTDEMKKSAEAAMNNYKSTYGESYQAFLEYNGIADDKELKDILIKNTKLTSVIDDYIKKDLTEKEMKKYYEESIYGDISAKHILISFDYESGASEDEIKAAEEKAKTEAEALIERIKNGEDFSALAKEYSKDDASKENGGDLGYFNTGDMVKEFEEAAYALEVNEYTKEPVKTTYGYHIILKTGAKKKPSYKKSKDTVIEKLIDKAKAEDSTISAKAMKALREKYNLKIKDKTIKKEYEDYIKQATTPVTTTKASE